MLVKQPFFVGGIDDVELAKNSAFGAAGTFFFTFCVCIFYLIHNERRIIMTEDSDHFQQRRPTTPRGILSSDYGQVPLSDVHFDTPQLFDRGAVYT
jgi:hypothetical protein